MDRAKLAAALIALAALAAVGIAMYSRGGDTGGKGSSSPAPSSPAPAPAPPPPAVGEDVAIVSGTVRDVVTGDGIEGVDVLVRGDGKHVVTSGTRGVFELRVAPGRYRVSARGGAHVSIADTSLAVGERGTARDLVVRVVALATVAGVVVDADGAPLAGASVACTAALSGVSVAIRPGECVTTSGDDGAFRLTVPPGRVELRAQVADRPEGTVLLRWVAPGAELVGIELVVDHPASVSGLVRDRAGTAIPGAQVSATGEAAQPAATAVADEAGRFRLDGLGTGTLRLEARADGYGPAKSITVDVSAGVEQSDVVLTLTPDAPLAGRIVDAAGSPVAGALASATRAGSSLTSPAVTTGADGTFELTGVGRGSVDLEVSAPGFASARRAGLSAPVAGLEIALERTGSVAGVVRANGAPVTHVAVELTNHVPLGIGVPAAATPAQHLASADGAYRIDDLAPGRYDLAVSAHGFAPQMVLGISIAPAATTERDFDLVQGATVMGKVTNGRTGNPVVSAFVQLSTGHSGEVAYTDAAGAFHIDDIAPGRRSISFGRPGFVGHIQSGIELHASDRRVVDAVLQPIESSTVPAGGELLEFSGIGAALRWDDDTLVVEQVMPRGPAAIAGLQSGDIIEAIDGVATRGRGLGANIEDIRGVVGTAVRLRIARDDDTPFVLNIVRATVQIAGDIGGDE